MKNQTFTLQSNELGGVGTLEQAHPRCGGENKSPQLYWINPPKGTKSFAVTMYDKDAPSGSGFWHWIVFNLPFSTHELLSDAGDISKHIAPGDAIQSLNDTGNYGYTGPCPPPGDNWHSYMITVYALDIMKLQLDKEALPAQVGLELWKHTLEKASVVFYYKI
ncbi:YbhB/YbcL family Raf kinase inhibitor-like protein [uncultured Sanguibacteroides sp.]|uniref:YbhB/YbcL family Raf kinase inhibitor-like protein n=1 Tax=uncultured Sanguibacteroides sp. TaxID=1635151 RepID=UPI0025DBD6D7|nr:YbhB/YbcL family Raf kinase inhibitor-like protein [uncultured Sanguibacteroides sp.]